MSDQPVPDGRPDAPAPTGEEAESVALTEPEVVAEREVVAESVAVPEQEPQLEGAAASEADQAPGRLGRLSARLAALWASVRPRTRRGAALGVAAVAGLSAVFSLAFLFGAGAFASFYGEFGFHPDTDAARWAAHEPAFGEAALCASCHAPEYAKATTARHAGIGCETCHGPLLAHAQARAEGATEDVATTASDGAAPIEARLAVPTDEVCVRCHVQAVGRPEGFRQIVPADHYQPVCLQCHDPHTGISKRPPVVQHPLDDHLPPCVTCHGPEGFKARDQRHPDVGTNDAACLACHLPGRGPQEEASR